ncbi:hypothetical protein AV530_009418 [Patagioenas fasciata monilis]|uniref:Uncharacterized protein n=1 Tax=Patagioenas fasciata monilis TaxID=372326 RepID=A0A1V4JIY6_PATFA|nr:hypothetical protein AV530_009418 [Patagioenas fasciata monilis]
MLNTDNGLTVGEAKATRVPPGRRGEARGPWESCLTHEPFRIAPGTCSKRQPGALGHAGKSRESVEQFDTTLVQAALPSWRHQKVSAKRCQQILSSSLHRNPRDELRKSR